MTTHNTHHDQSDVDPSIVETTPASEMVTDTTTSLPERDAMTAPSSPEQLPAAESTEAQDAPSPQTIEHTTLSEELTPFGDLPSSDSLPSQSLETPISQAEEADTLAEQTVQSPSAEADSVPVVEDATSSPLVAGSATEDLAPSQAETLAAQPVPEIETIADEITPVLNESPLLSEASTSAKPDSSIEQTIVQSQPLFEQASETSPAVEEPSPAIEEPTFPYASILSFAEPKNEEVRSFSDFIEEFRQAEALQETYVDFSLLTPTVLDIEVPSEIFEGPTHDAIFLPTTSSPELVLAEAEAKQEEAVQNKGVEPTITPEVRPITEKQEIKPDLISGQLTPTPITRVSPLLRPASRLRIPRHGSRHHREEPIQEPIQEPLSAEQPTTPPAPVEPQKPADPVVEPTPDEQPRPARRYRFDRPSSTSGATSRASAPGQSGVVPPIAPQRPEEPREKENIQSRSATPPSFGRPELSRQEPTARPETLPIEPLTPPVAKNSGNAQTQEQANPAQEQPETLPGTLETNENGRRRHHQERQPKEHAVVNPVQSVPVVAEIVLPAQPTPPEPIAPEDLPPLEYSDLQKANPRRRRRHRNIPATSNDAVQSTPEAPALLPVLPPSIPLPVPAPLPVLAPLANLPLEPAPSRNGDNQFSIVSGYTVSQMNQGNEVTGPFMGPEPSPARGSVASRDGRTTRAEMQRTTVYPTPVRTTHEGAPSASSLNHLANVVSQSIQQSIQLQTDRMVTELRRANQSPTSVSVSLPPFPSTERVGVFVDVANLLYSARTLRISVDFGKLLDFLRGNRRLVRAQAYCPTSPQAGDEQMFLQAVKGLGYRITTKNYKTFSSGAKKADLDLDLCMDVVRLVDGRAVDCVVLVSGDSDFMPMLDYCSDHGVRVEVAAFDEAMSATLRQSCDLFVNLSMLEEIRS